MWSEKKSFSFVTQDGEHYPAAEKLEAYLILLVNPNKDAIENIGNENLPYIILFSEILEDFEVSTNNLLEELEIDLTKILNVLKNPTAGKLVKKEFLEKRKILKENAKL